MDELCKDSYSAEAQLFEDESNISAGSASGHKAKQSQEINLKRLGAVLKIRR